jgi:RNA polymerase sigma-70 factor (ECF subfamily)
MRASERYFVAGNSLVQVGVVCSEVRAGAVFSRIHRIPARYDRPHRALRAEARQNSCGLGTRPLTKECTSRLDVPILQRIAAGDQSAVKACLDRYAGLVWSLARRMCINSADAEDAVQEIFIEIWRNAYRFDPQVASESTFVAMIARRRLIDRQRKAARQRERTLPEEPQGVASGRGDNAQLADEVGVASRALAELNPEQQKVLRLSLLFGLSHEKIARATGLPVGTVKTHARRGLIRIRELISGGERPRGVKS